MPPYVMDSCVWINVNKYNPPDIFQRLWGKIREASDAGEIRSPEEVFHELDRGVDDLATKLRSWDGLFVPLNDELQEAVTRVVSQCPGLVDPEGLRNRADAFVVGLAAATGGSVVSEEKPRKHPTGPHKVPDACGELGVLCMNWLGFLRTKPEWDL